MEKVKHVKYETYTKSKMTMSLNDIVSIRTLTYNQCEQIKHTGDIINDHKYKRKKLILNTKEASRPLF
jgi:hypothetical protein